MPTLFEAYGLEDAPKPAAPPPEPEQAGVGRTLADVAIKGAQGVVGIGQSFVGMGDLISGGAVGRQLDSFGYDPDQTNAVMGEFLSDSQKRSDKAVEDATGFVDTTIAAVKNPRFILGSLAQSAPGILAMGAAESAVAARIAAKAALGTAEGATAAAGLTGTKAIDAALATKAGNEAASAAVNAAAGRLVGVGAVAEGAQAAGQIADQAQRAGRSYTDYALPAIAAGVGDAAISFGTGKLLGDAATEVFTGAKQSALAGSRPVRALKAAGSEFTQETLQSGQEQAFTNVAMGEQDIWKGVPEAAAQGGVTGAALGGALGLGSKPHAQAKREIEAQYADQLDTAKRMREGGDAAAADMVERNVAKKIGGELSTFELGRMSEAAPDADFHQNPVFQAQYQSMRQSGTTPAEAAARAAAVSKFWELGRAGGLSDKAITAAVEVARDQPMDRMGEFLGKYADSLKAKGIGQVGNIAPDLDGASEEAMTAVANGIYGRAASEDETNAVLDRMDKQAQRELAAQRDFSPEPQGEQDASTSLPVQPVAAGADGIGSADASSGVVDRVGVAGQRDTGLDATSTEGTAAAVPARVDAAGQPSGALENSRVVGSDAGNGFKHGPQNGERYRVGVVDSVGGAIAIEKRYPAGTAGTFYVGKDGNLIDGDSINLIGSGKEKLWIPATPERAKQAQQILDEMGQLDLQDPARKDAKERLKQVVSGKSNEASARMDAAGVQPDAVAPVAPEAKRDSASWAGQDTPEYKANSLSGEMIRMVKENISNNDHSPEGIRGELLRQAEESNANPGMVLRSFMSGLAASPDISDYHKQQILQSMGKEAAASAPQPDPRLTPISQRNVSPEAQNIDTSAAPVAKAAEIEQVAPVAPQQADVVKIPERIRYYVTKSPAYDGIEPLSVEDSDFELEALENSAKKGRLTPEAFVQSEIGKRIDMVSIIGLQSSLKANPVGTIQALRSHIENKSEPAQVEAPNAAPVDSRLVPVSQRQAPAQREATEQERQIARNSPAMLDLKKSPTGWKAVPVENGNGTVLVSSDGKFAVPFISTNLKSGTEGLRQSAAAQGYAIDNPYAADMPSGELVATPIFKRESATPDQRLVPVSQRQPATPTDAKQQLAGAQELSSAAPGNVAGSGERIRTSPLQPYEQSLSDFDKQIVAAHMKQYNVTEAEARQIDPAQQHLDHIEEALEAGKKVDPAVLAEHKAIDAKEYPLAAKLAKPNDGGQGGEGLTEEQFRALPESVRNANRDLADLDDEVARIEKYTPINPRTLANQSEQLKQAAERKRELLTQGATQEGADLVRSTRDKTQSATLTAPAAKTDAGEITPTAAKQKSTDAKQRSGAEGETPAADAAKAGKIDDFGEKLEGARKDYAATLKDALAVDVATEPLSKSWPEPDYQKLLDGGADPFVVAWVHASRDEIPTKPQRAWKIKNWAEQVKLLRDMSSKLLDGQITKTALQEKLARSEFEAVRNAVGGRADLYQAVGHEKSLKGVTLKLNHYTFYKGVQHPYPGMKMWAVEQQAKATAFGNWPHEIATGEDREKVIEAFKAKYADLQTGPKKRTGAASFVIYRKRGEPGAFVGKKIGREYIDLHKAEDLKAARDYLDKNTEALETALEKYKETPYERNTENAPRVGGDHRNGAPVTPEIFSDTFGFRGVQFGNYVEQGRRQSDLNQAFDALMDMAAVLDLPPRALSLNGRLGLAFGARGKGGKNAPAAHYEPGTVVINLTKGGGPGSLAHEWFHSMDNYFAKEGGTAGFMTESARGDALREEMRAAFKAIKQEVNAGAYKKRAQELDKRKSKPYWATPVEMSARAFESYIIAKLQDQSAANDYLANIVSEQAWNTQEAIRAEFFTGKKAEPSYPYPTADEIPAIRAAFDEFFKTVQTKEDDAGNVAMFSRKASAEEQNALKTLSEIDELYALPKSDKTTVADITADNDPEIKVTESKQTGQQVYTFTMPDGVKATMTVRPYNKYGKSVYSFDMKDGEPVNQTTERPGENAEEAEGKDDVWIDVSKLSRGEYGTKIYNIAATYAHNTGKIFIGDPAGLSVTALRRRLENMISNALKFGTTEHLAPHPDQVTGGHGVPALKWVYGDDVGNIERMIDASVAATDNVFPTAKNIGYDPDAGTFVNTVTGRPVPSGRLSAVLRSSIRPADASNRGSEGTRREGASASEAGWRTLARRAVFASLLEIPGRPGRGRGILEGLVRQRDQLVSPTTGERIFYSKGAGSNNGLTAELSTAGQYDKTAVQSAVDAIIEKWATKLGIHVIGDMSESPVPVYNYWKKQDSQGATGAIEGFHYQGEIWIVASAMKSYYDVARVIFHEGLGHAGLRGAFGNALDDVLDQIAVARRPEVVRKAGQYKLDMTKQADRRMAAEEVLAEMAQTRPEIGFVRRAIAAIKTWLRANVPFFRDMALTNDEILHNIILPARGFVERGRRAASSAPELVPAFSKGSGVWKSALEDGVFNINAKALTPAMWKDGLKGLVNKGLVKQDEITWSGLDDWLTLQQGKVPKESVLQYLQDNGVRVTETHLGSTVDAAQELTDKLKPYGITVEHDPIENDLVYIDKDGDGINYEDMPKEAQAIVDRVSQGEDGSITGPAKYATYQLPGGRDYRELLLTLPQRDTITEKKVAAPNGWGDTDGGNVGIERTGNTGANYRSSHWDQPNVLAHIRFNERTDADGKRVLFIEEIQSDWGQAGKKKGFSSPPVRAERIGDHPGGKIGNTMPGMYRVYSADGKVLEPGAGVDWFGATSEAEALAKARSGLTELPAAAPFVTKTDAWVSLALKRMIRYAVDNGFDKVAFVNGEQSAERYDLSKQISRVEYTDKGVLTATDINGREVLREEVPENKIEDYIGKEAARKLLEAKPVRDPGRGDINAKTRRIEGDGLKVGGEGMKSFYDSIVPNVTKDVLKKIGGGQMETVSIPNPHRPSGSGNTFAEAAAAREKATANWKPTLDQPGFTITPAMREKASGGLPMFSKKTDQTDTPAFKAWFKGSKVVDAQGKPLVVYHGTKADFSVFMRTRGGEFGPAIYLTDSPREASEYGDGKGWGGPSGTQVMPLYVSIKNPYTKGVDAFWKEFGTGGSDAEGVAAAQAAGYDGIIAKRADRYYDNDAREFVDRGGELTHYIAFDPTQVKSAIGNNGDFSPTNPDIRFSRAADATVAQEPYTFANRARDLFHDVADKQTTFNWWNNTIGTQYQKAQQDKHFKRVFDATQDYILDVSRLANQSADLARDLLPKLENFSDVLKHTSTADVQAIAKPVFQGTLSEKRVYKPEELKRVFGLSDKQVELYKQFRLAVDKSIDDLSTTTAAKLMRYAGFPINMLQDEIEAGDHRELARMAAEVAKEDPKVKGLADQIKDISDRAQTLKAEAYAPLMRFGQYAVSVRDPLTKELKQFYLLESQAAANKKARLVAGAGVVEQSVMSTKDYELLKGVSPESLELFGDILEKAGMFDTRDELFQTYLRRAIDQRSAMKRMIERHGYPGYSEDMRRVLATFVTSNARLASKNLHFSNMLEAAENIPKEKGDVRDEATALVKYVQEPVEEAAKIRGLLFANYLGGSVASALTNMTQTITMTVPYLSQFSSPIKAGAALAKGMKQAVSGITDDKDLANALAKAEQAGLVSPQEIHHLNAEAMGTFGSHPAVQKAMFLWGSLFSLAEQSNRKSTFIAAFNMARELGKRDPYAFAQKAVEETQGIYNRGNRPDWARGAIGATVFTFKQFSISYLEFLSRLPAREKVLALAILMLAAGGEGLPFADDLDDIIDTIAQKLGYNFNSKKKKREFIGSVLGQGGADFVLKGMSAIPGLPIDVSGRMGMANLIPGSGVMRKDAKDHMADALEVLGPAGGFMRDTVNKTWLPTTAAELSNSAFTPVAIRNLAKSADMFQTGMYRDTKGRKVIDTTAADAIWKAVGFQPAEVAKESQRARIVQQGVSMAKISEAEIADQMAQARFEGSIERYREAREKMEEWNRKNPESRMSISTDQVARRVKEMKMDREQRIIKSAPRELRGNVKAQLVQ